MDEQQNVQVHEAKGLRVDLSQARWRKSSASGPYSDNCVEVADVQVMVDDDAHPAWRKSTRSTDVTSCVETAAVANGVAVRDSKDPGGPVLLFTRAEWDAFIAGAKGGEFDM